MGSDYKNEIIQFIISVYKNHEIAFSLKVSNGVYVDVYFPDRHCAIIFNSMEKVLTDKKVKSNNPHQAEPKIKIVHLWEDQWVFHEAKIRSKLKSLMGITERIHGRETNIISIDNSQLMHFLNVNHLNVPIKAKYKFGLLKDNELVAAMSFSKGRKIVRENVVFNSYEMLRFCNKLNLTVVGGFSKLLLYFMKIQIPDDVMTYVDCDWSDGQSFLAKGFELLERIPSIEFWLNMKTGEREYPHLVLKKHKKSMLDFESDNEKISFLIKNGYVQIYNTGSYKYILKRKKY